MSIWWIGLALAADCGFQATEQELNGTLAAAEQAYSSLDGETFRRTNDELRLAFPCVDVPLQPTTVARVARVRALSLAASGNDEAALTAMRASRHLDPTYVFADDLLAPGHALRTAYEELPTDDGPRTKMAPPRGVTVLLDGTEGTMRPTDRPVVFQLREGTQVRDTQLLWPGDPAPPYPVVPVARNRLLWTAAGLGAGAAALYGGAWASRGGLDRVEGRDALEGVRTRTNVLGGLSIALAVGAGSTATAAALVGQQ